eukprot:CAMPEP_0174894310 /NCGR_PEP_ID=MMETSP0167-20121228/8962_1 /TAXON_ID=38298 /ORGANISM="Rhodella maculata, Strain CCMP736" /LENGTH=83 /DNA_ID=CAMNT_0016133353 /DNA_START=11 /DNA_END=263 /DNA_ORIENTATION=+
MDFQACGGSISGCFATVMLSLGAGFWKNLVGIAGGISLEFARNSRVEALSHVAMSPPAMKIQLEPSPVRHAAWILGGFFAPAG